MPFLLQLASVEIDQSEAAGVNAAGEEEMNLSGDEFDPSEEEIAAEAAREPLAKQNAGRWDRFLSWVRSTEDRWLEDSDDYRKQRALIYCNGARAVSRDLYALKPTMASWVPHIACNIVPRQIVELGDPTSRAADACESYGACCKKLIKHLTCRRNVTRAYSRGWVEQAFRRLAVRSDLLHGAENVPFLLRADHKLLGSGMLGNVSNRVEGPAHSIRVKVEHEAASG